MRILALDLATRTGWAHSNGPSGVQDFSLRRGDSPGMRWLRFSAWLREMVEVAPMHVIAYEQAHHRGGAATHVAHALIGQVEAIAAQRNVQITSYHTSEIKKYATGKGNASKVEMLDAAKERWPDVEIIDDNHADALWLLSLAQSELES